MANLYEISQAMLDCIDPESGEVIDCEKLNELSMQYDEKIEGIGLWIKNLLSDMEAYKKEKEAFAEREKAAKAKAESLKKYLASALDGQKFSTAKVAISFRQSEAVTIAEGAHVPDEYIRRKVTEEPDKTALKKALKSGENIPGVTLEKTQSVQIS